MEKLRKERLQVILLLKWNAYVLNKLDYFGIAWGLKSFFAYLNAQLRCFFLRVRVASPQLKQKAEEREGICRKQRNVLSIAQKEI